MKVLKYLLPIFPIPFLFHFYEYNSHLAKQTPIFLFPGFIFFIILAGMLLKNVKLHWVFLLGAAMTLVSWLLGHVFIPNDGGWFKPFERDTVILGTATIYVLGLLIVRWLSKWITQQKV